MQKYGLIGYPLGHSYSMDFFNKKFRSENIDAVYQNFEIANIKELKTVLKNNPELCGLNVTIPYKEQVIPYLDDLDDDARQIGAVNVIKFTKGFFGKTKLIGYNSDIIGFKQSIDPLLNETHRKALILGTGGASKAVFQGLKQLGVGATLVSRTPKENCITYESITPKIMEQYTVIVNTTPLGMYPNIHNCPNIPYELLTPNHLLYDLLYNPDETEFMLKGSKYDWDDIYRNYPSFCLPDNIMLLNFNYTNTANQYVQAHHPIFEINHIHGELSKPESIIFGYGDELDENYKKISNLNDNEYLANFKSIKYLESDRYRKALQFMDAAPYQVFIMGHSCGNSDRTFLNTLFEHKNCVSIKPYYYKNGEKDNYLEIVQNISRNFTDMKLMRDRVVNKTYCETFSEDV